MELIITTEAFYFYALIVVLLAAIVFSFLAVVFAYAISEKTQGRSFWAAVEYGFDNF